MSRGPEDNKHCILLSEKEGIYSDVCTNNNEKLWGNGIIPFIFNDNVTEELKNFVMEAMERIAKESIIKFVEREHQRDYIEIIDEGEFASYVGRKGGKQKLYVTIDKNKWPRPIGNAIHELMHVLGFFHEHCRPDRDRYVIVEKTGINYEKHTESCVIYFGPYDLKSIMHYSEGQGVTLKPEINAETGQRVKLSDGDKYALNELYPPEIIVSRLKEIYENLRKKIQSLFPENDPKYLKFKEHEKLIKSREQELELLRVKKCEIVQVFERDYPKHRESEVIQDKINQEFNKVYMEKNRERNKTELIRLRNMEFDILKEIKDIDHPGYEIMRLTQNSVKRRKIDPSGSDARRKLMKLEFKILNIIHKEYKTLFNKLNQDEVCHREREMEDNIIRQEVSE